MSQEGPDRILREEDIGFPLAYLSPISTPHGLAYPGPRIRLILDDIENVQKRMASVQVLAHPERLKRVFSKKKEREEEFARLKTEHAELQKEMNALMTLLGKFEATPEQFMPPTQEIRKYGSGGPSTSRIVQEKWAEQYKTAMQERSERLKTIAEANDAEEKAGEDAAPPIGTFLSV